MKKLLVGLLWVVGLWGQSGQQVVNVLITNSTTVVAGTPTTFTFPASGGLQNIGQTNHEIRISDIGGFAGTFWGVTGDVQGSLDGSHWFNIGPNASSFQYVAGGTAKVTGINSYPYLRANITVSATGGNVTVKVVYIGNSVPTINTPISTAPLYVNNDDMQYGEVQSYAFGAGEERGFVGQNCRDVGLVPMLYGLTLTNEANTDTIIYIRQYGVTSTGDAVIWNAYLPAKSNVLLANLTRAVFVGSGGSPFTRGEQMQVHISSSAATTVSAYINFRCEPSL